MSMWAVPMKAILHGRCCQGWIKGSVTFPGFGMLSGKLIHITFRTFHNIRCLLIYNISRGKRLANIFSYKNSNSLLKVSLLEPAWSPAKYSYSLSLQPLIYAFLSKRHLEEVFIFSYQLLISEFGACSFSFWGVCFCFFKYQIFFHFIGFENGQKKPKCILYFQFYVVFCIFVLKFSHKSNAILFLN